MTLTLLLLLTGLFLVACGDQPSSGSTSGQSSGSATSRKLDPCALVSKEQASAVLGATIDQPTSQAVGPSSSCSYNPHSSLNILTVTVFDHTYTKDQFETELKTSQALLKETPQTVQGVGDEAIYFDSLLNVLKGDNYFVVSIVNPGLSEQDKIEKLKQVASQITQKL
ncbi:MAG TPA: DUF3558 family protein [Chloroflexia bacterium]|nr:DUF3558 family protein [Chloroflexia bacterium]